MKDVEQPLLSVIVPVYNVENYIKKCINSIREQTYQNLDIIIVDDGSTDSSGKICDEYEKQDMRIHVIHQENKGLLAARFVGVENACGEYVTFVDSDDWIEKQMYMGLLSKVLESQADIVISGIYRYWNDDNMIQDLPCIEEGVYRKDDIRNIIPVMLWDVNKGRQRIDPSLCTKIFRKNIIKKYLQKSQELDVYLGEDSCVIYPVMLEISKMVVVNKCYYFHRQREKDKIASYLTDELYFEKLFRLFIYLKDIFKKSDYKEILLKQLDYFYMRFIRLRRECYVQINETTDYIFPYKEVPEGSNIILYGAGAVGQAYKEQNDKYHFCNIILWVDKKYECSIESKEVFSPNVISKYEYDYILIAVRIPELAKEIKNELVKRGIETEKIIWAGTITNMLSS